MGLYISNDCWEWSYIQFMEWRNRLALAAGYGLKKAKPYMPVADIDWDKWAKPELLLGKWNEESLKEVPDPLYFLIVHADDEGAIYPAQAAPLAERLDELLKKDFPRNYYDMLWHIPRTVNFINGLHFSIKHDCPLHFG